MLNFAKSYQNRIILAFGLIVLGINSQFNLYNKLISADTEKKLNDFITFFLGLIVEATPFVLIGVLVSIFVAFFIKEEWIFKFIPKNRVLANIVLSLMGILMPVCECGNVPVVRRLMLKGFSVSQSVTFLLAAPIVNPITFWATSEAFNLDGNIVWIRIGAALFIANFIGFIVSLNKSSDKEFLNTKFYSEVCDHEHDEQGNYKERFFKIFETEFIGVMKMLIIGAILAALSQTFIPRDAILSIGKDPFLSIIAMIILAFVISICANVDAFYASTFINSFTTGSLVSFLVFGPMIDMKMLVMLEKTFKIKFLAIISTLVLLLSIIVGLLVNYFY